MRLNYVFLFEFLLLFIVFQIIIKSTGQQGTIFDFVGCFTLGFFIDNILSWLHGKKMSLFLLDNDEKKD